LPVESFGEYKEVLTSDEERYGGKGIVNKDVLKAETYIDQNGKEKCYVKFNLPALSGVIIRKTNGKIRRG
jgi:1,4-alpha-glucan branching enzyme